MSAASTQGVPGPRGAPRPVVALDGVDLHVDDGELVCIVGASGCGKSTLLNIVGGLETATTGEVRVDGDLVVGPGPDRGMVFQAYSLFPWKIGAPSNIAFGLECAGLGQGRRAERVDELLGIMGLGRGRRATGPASSRAACASGWPSPGRWRPEPDVLLLDEPFGALDAQTKRSMHDFLLHVRHAHRVHHPDGHPRRRRGRLPVAAGLRAVGPARPGRRGDRGALRASPRPDVQRDPRFLDLRDEIEDLLSTRPAA